MRVLPALLCLLSACVGTITGGESLESVDAGVRQPDAPPVDPNAIKRLYEDWSGCMTLENFQSSNMAAAWGGLASTDSARKLCRGCHENGEFGFMATLDEAKLFSALSQHSRMLAMYVTADVANNQIVVNTVTFQSADNKPGHPRFDPLDNAGMTALRAFHAATEANTACGAPTLVD